MKFNRNTSLNPACFLRKTAVLSVSVLCFTIGLTAQSATFQEYPLTASAEELPKTSLERLKDKNKPSVKTVENTVMVFDEASVKTTSAKADVELFSIPADNLLNIEINEASSNRILTITSAAGFRMQSIRINKTGGTVTIDVTGYPAGTYTADVVNEAGVKITKMFAVK